MLCTCYNHACINKETSLQQRSVSASLLPQQKPQQRCWDVLNWENLTATLFSLSLCIFSCLLWFAITPSTFMMSPLWDLSRTGIRSTILFPEGWAISAWTWPYLARLRDKEHLQEPAAMRWCWCWSSWSQCCAERIRPTVWAQIVRAEGGVSPGLSKLASIAIPHRMSIKPD